MRESITAITSAPEPRYVYGLTGLAKLLTIAENYGLEFSKLMNE